MKPKALRIEWCKARARAHRWQEECILLAEEMRRVIQFHRWQANVWERRADDATSAGARAYAWRQHATRQTLIARCQQAWLSMAQFLAVGEGAVTVGEPLIECHTRIGHE